MIMETDKELIKSINNLKEEIEKNNKILQKSEVKNIVVEKHDIIYYTKRYIQEIIEASFGLFAVMLITKREFTIKEIIKIACIIGFITLILEEYNLEYSNNFKQGIHFTMGAVALGG